MSKNKPYNQTIAALSTITVILIGVLLIIGYTMFIFKMQDVEASKKYKEIQNASVYKGKVVNVDEDDRTITILDPKTNQKEKFSAFTNQQLLRKNQTGNDAAVKYNSEDNEILYDIKHSKYPISEKEFIEKYNE